MNELERDMKEMSTVTGSLDKVEKSGNNITLHLKVRLADGAIEEMNILDTTKIVDVVAELKQRLKISFDIFFLCELKEDGFYPVKFYNSFKTLYQERITDKTIIGFRMNWIVPLDLDNMADNDMDIFINV